MTASSRSPGCILSRREATPKGRPLLSVPPITSHPGFSQRRGFGSGAGVVPDAERISQDPTLSTPPTRAIGPQLIPARAVNFSCSVSAALREKVTWRTRCHSRRKEDSSGGKRLTRKELLRSPHRGITRSPCDTCLCNAALIIIVRLYTFTCPGG